MPNSASVQLNDRCRARLQVTERGRFSDARRAADEALALALASGLQYA